MLFRVLLILSLLSVPGNVLGGPQEAGQAASGAQAEGPQRVRVEGMVSLDGLTPREGILAALRRARLAGVSASCGVSAENLSWSNDPESLMRFISMVGRSQVLEEKVERWDAVVEHDHVQRPPAFGLRVVLDIRVDCGEAAAGSSPFKVDAALDSLSYHPGDVLSLEVTPSHESYITVIRFAPDDSVHLFYPNSVQPGRVVKGGETLVVPTSMGRRTGLVRLEARGRPGSESSWGLIWVVALRNRVELAPLPALGEGLASLGGTSEAARRMAEWLISTPSSGRAMKIIHYEVRGE